MNLVKALRASPQACIAFVGAGGKTSTIFTLARAFEGAVIVTATTHFGENQISLADQNYIIESPSDFDALEDTLLDGITLLTGPVGSDRRSTGLDQKLMKRVKAFADSRNLPLLIEADGSRQRPLKAAAEHEPVIPEFVDSVVVMAGMSALGQPLNAEWVHRPEIFGKSSRLTTGDEITPAALANVLVHNTSGLKEIPEHARRIALLNQNDSVEKESAAQQIATRLLPTYHAVLVADIAHYSEERPSQVHAVHEAVAGIILAGGESKRMGEPKQLLDWHGEPFVRHIAQTALSAGLSPVVVVTGADAELVNPVISDLPVSIVHNPNWQSGQSESVKVGLAALPGNAGSAIFLLVDQPQVPISLLQNLIAAHATSLAAIVAPQVDGQRGNPVLFDRVTFPELAEISGDVGGRAIFSRYQIEWIPWLDASLRIDVDTREDYDRLIRHAE